MGIRKATGQLHYIAAIFLILLSCGPGLAQEYHQTYKSTANQYPPPPVERKDFAPIRFIDAPGATAIFTEVVVDPIHLEEVKDDIRKKLPNAHVRRIISGAPETDQTLMIMWHPKEAFRPAINDFFRVLDTMRGVRGTRTHVGVSNRFPEQFPGDTLIGWKFIQFDHEAQVSPAARVENIRAISNRLLNDPDVLEVSRLAGANFDVVVVYRFSGASVGAIQEVSDRIHSLFGSERIKTMRDYLCP